MVIEKTVESKELALFTENEEIFNRWIIDIVRNLAKKYNKGIFDNDKAIDAFYPVACKGSELYNKNFGYSFTVTERFSAAADMVSFYMDNIINNVF